MKLTPVETKYKWSEVGYVKDEKVVEDVVAGVLRQAIEVPEHCELFNPVAALSWILQEEYVTTVENEHSNVS